MSMMVPPGQRQQSLPPLRPAHPIKAKALLAKEWRHLVDMSPLTLMLALLPSLVIFYINPLLPLTAYLLQLWASSSWSWRDRWASIGALARQGGWFVALVLVYTVLSSAHVWIFPALTESLQAFWRTHLPGDLSLSPPGVGSLLVRVLLLLPLAPALALLYEHLNPRTSGQLSRVLTPADLMEITSTPTPKARAVSSAALSVRTADSLSPTARSRSRHKPGPEARTPGLVPPPPRDGSPIHQMALEGFFATEQVAASKPEDVPTHPKQSKKARLSVKPLPQELPPKTTINWDEVVE